MYTTNEKQFPEFNFIKQDYGEPQYKKEEGRILDRETKKNKNKNKIVICCSSAAVTQQYGRRLYKIVRVVLAACI